MDGHGGLLASYVDLGDRLTGHHGLLILGEEAHDLARCACFHLVERLHDLDETNRVVLRDGVAVGFVGWFVGRWLAVEYARERRNDLLYSHEFLVLWSLRPWPAAPQCASCLRSRLAGTGLPRRLDPWRDVRA